MIRAKGCLQLVRVVLYYPGRRGPSREGPGCICGASWCGSRPAPPATRARTTRSSSASPGTAGGREFPFDVQWFDDAQRGSDEKYAFGEVWDPAALAGARQPRMAETDWNDPKLSYVGFAGIDRIYLRKQPAAAATTPTSST